MRIKSLCIAAAVTVLTFAGSWRAQAQLAAPGESGVAQGHLHLAVRDLETGQKFWAMLGGTPIQNGALQLIQFPGTFVMLRKAEPSGGTVGSTVEHFGFHVKNLSESLAQWQAAPAWQAAGVKWAPTNATQGFLTGPDDVRIEVIQNTAIDTPIRFHHVHFFTASAVETQAWYAKMFGAAPGKRASFDAADLPGVNLTFSKADGPVVGTTGPIARSHRVRGQKPRTVHQEARSQRHQDGPPVHEDCELGHRDRVSDRSLGHVHRADGEPRAGEVRADASIHNLQFTIYKIRNCKL